MLNTRPVIWIGLLSYSLYLWQQPFLNRHSSSWVAAFPANLLFVFSAAIVSYYILEQPFMKLRRRFRPTSFGTDTVGSSSFTGIAVAASDATLELGNS